MKATHALLPWAPLIARVLVGGTFVLSGINKLQNFDAMVGVAQAAGIPSPEIAIVLALVVELLGGLSVMLGYRIFWGALGLLVFTVLTSFIFHADFADPMQKVLFTKNMGIAAALLYMTRFGAGKMAVEK